MKSYSAHNVLHEDSFPEAAAEIEAALLWHGPRVVPEAYTVVECDKGKIWRFNHTIEQWEVKKNGQWAASKITKWRYPAPVKIEE